MHHCHSSTSCLHTNVCMFECSNIIGTIPAHQSVEPKFLVSCDYQLLLLGGYTCKYTHKWYNSLEGSCTMDILEVVDTL